jgi:hypothetical protein
MEKTYKNCGLSAEQIADIFVGMMKDLILAFDFEKLIENAKKKHSYVTEEQWKVILANDYDHFPKTEEEAEQMIDDMGVKDLYMALYNPEQEENPEEPAEE